MPKARKPNNTRAVDEVDAQIGVLLRAQRISKGMSQTELGNAVGVTFQQIQKYEKGANRIGGGRLKRLAATLDVPVAYFFGQQVPTDLKGDTEVMDLLRDRHAVELLRVAARLSGEQKRLLIGFVRAVSGGDLIARSAIAATAPAEARQRARA